MTDSSVSPVADSSPGESNFRVVTTVAPEATTVGVAGSIDMVTAPPFAHAVAAAQADLPQALLIDLSGVDFLGSAGLSVLVDAARRASDSGSAMVIVADNHPVVHALEVTGLDTVLTIVPTAAQALRGLAGEAADS